MDTILITVAVTAVVIGLLWLSEKFVGVLPRPMNSSETNARLLWILGSLGAMAFWLGSLDRVMESQSWSLDFFNNLLWVIVVPVPFFYCSRRVFSRNPELFPALSKLSPEKLPARPLEADTESEILATLQRGEKLEAIQRYRVITGAGLEEAKDFVEKLMIRDATSEPIRR